MCLISILKIVSLCETSRCKINLSLVNNIAERIIKKAEKRELYKYNKVNISL